MTSSLITTSLTRSWEGMSYITSSMAFSRIERNPRAPVLRFRASRADRHQSPIGKLQIDLLHFKELLVLLHQGIFRFLEDLNERFLVELIQRGHHRQPTDELRDQAVLEKIDGLDLGKNLAEVLAFLLPDIGAEPHGLRPGALGDNRFQAGKGATADKQNVAWYRP